MSERADEHPTLSSPGVDAPSSAVETAITVRAWSSLQPSAASPPLVAQRYEILGLLGSGGMATVYRARDLELDETVVLKVLRSEIAEMPGAVERFRREAKLARRVTHHNVARVFDIGGDAGEKFLTMEFVDGESLAALLARERSLPADRAIAIAVAIAAGLAGAHEAGVVHRDLKPENVLIGRDGRVVVTDFGIARAVQEAGESRSTLGDDVYGTPQYMAPEQVMGGPSIDARADIYAFGALLFELFTGGPAWIGPSSMAVASARLLAPAPDPRLRVPDLPAPLAELILRCMARRPEDRPASIEDVAADLRAIALPANRPAPAATTTLQTAPLPEERAAGKTVAVLPFRNAGAPEDDYLAAELTDDLIDALSMTEGLRVRPRGVVARFRDVDLDPRAVGRELGVQVVVEGSVRRAAGHVRISARLIAVADGFQLWAKRIERPDQEVLSINDDVARAIASALTLAGGGVAREAPSDPAALDLYIRGRHEYRKFWPEHQRRALALFEQAAAIAPDDPTILSGLALALSRLSFFASVEGKARALAAAERAVAAAPHVCEPHLALGSVLLQMDDPKAALRELQKAVGRGPALAEAQSALGRLLIEVGAHEEGMWRLDAALGLDPDVPLALSALTRAHALLGSWTKADALHARLRQSEGALSFLALRARMSLWRRLPAAQYVQEAPRDMEHGLLWAMGELLCTGRMPEGVLGFDEIERVVQGGTRRRVLFYQMRAEIAAFLGDPEETLDALGYVEKGGLTDLFWLERCPLFDNVRKDPRYAAVHAIVKRRAEDILDTPRAR